MERKPKRKPSFDELIAAKRSVADPRKYEEDYRTADPARLVVLLAALSINDKTAPNLRWILAAATEEFPLGALCALHAIDAPDLVERVLAKITATPSWFASPRDQRMLRRGLELLPAAHDHAIELLAKIPEPAVAFTIAKAIAARKRRKR